MAREAGYLTDLSNLEVKLVRNSYMIRLLMLHCKPNHQMIEYCRWKIEYLRNASLRAIGSTLRPVSLRAGSGAGSRRIHFKKIYQENDGAQRFPQIFNLHSSIVRWRIN